jgi:hypothetical protein
VDIGGTTRDEKTEEKMLTGDRDFYGDSRDSENNIDINKQIMGVEAQASCAC